MNRISEEVTVYIYSINSYKYLIRQLIIYMIIFELLAQFFTRRKSYLKKKI